MKVLFTTILMERQKTKKLSGILFMRLIFINPCKKFDEVREMVNSLNQNLITLIFL